jgi:biopolymer transport protein ExbD
MLLLDSVYVRETNLVLVTDIQAGNADVSIKDGKITVNSAALTLEQLGGKLAQVSKFFPGQPVIIRADKEVKYDMLVKLLDTCRAADIWNFSFATDAAKGEGK